MVDIKGLDKARVAEALRHEAERLAIVNLNGDEFDERSYDEAFGKGAAQRAVDSINNVRAERESGGDDAKDAGGGKKELTVEEKVKMTKEAVVKILDILKELPPDVCDATVMYLQMSLPGPMGGMAGMLGGPFPFRGRFG